MSAEWREFHLPAELCTAAEKRFGSKFATIQELLEFLLHELVSDNADQLEQAEQHIIEERLKELGYI